ncbi:uncharacterized protein LOC118437065 [Folsomia candida]|uniref:uncharacterized protein LOC118437065 n=1 Tax=Folsomia candida TaxID=158441 RepID=UPI001605421E|nr:uncharacterized protein LOC118437065 [Folsomia candida]
MNMDSGSSSSGKSSSNFSSKDDGGDSFNNNNAVTKVLRNPLILNLIFARLSVPDLKSSRLVCHDWLDISTGFLAKRTSLHVNKLFRYDDSSKLVDLAPVNDKLVQRIRFCNNFLPSVPTNKTNEVISDAVRMLNFARVRHITVFITNNNVVTGSSVVRACQKLPILPNLTSLKFKVNPYVTHGTLQVLNAAHLLNLFVDAGPNLTSLNVAGALYPNLGGVKTSKLSRL